MREGTVKRISALAAAVAAVAILGFSPGSRAQFFGGTGGNLALTALNAGAIWATLIPETAAFVKDENRRWGEVIRKNNIVVD